MSYGNQYHGNQYIGPSLQERAQAPALERDPDGLCNLLSQSVDRASALNESLAKLNQHLSAALVQLREENARLKDRLEAQFKRLTSMDGLLANAEAGRKEQTMAADMIAEERDAYARACKSLIAQVAALESEVARLTARVQQRDKQIAVYNSGGFADADALAEKFIDLTNRIAALEAERDALKERRG